MALIMDLMQDLRDQLSLQLEEQMAAFKLSQKNLIKDIFKDLKEELGFNSLPSKKGYFEATVPNLQIEQATQDSKEGEIMEFDYEKTLKNRSEELEVGVEQDAESEDVDTETPKNYKLLIKAQQERFELTDLIIEKQQDSDNYDQVKVFVFDTLIVRKHKLRMVQQERNYFKVIRKVSWQDIENFKELMLLQGEEQNFQNVFEGWEKGWIDLWKIILGQIFKYILQFDTND